MDVHATPGYLDGGSPSPRHAPSDTDPGSVSGAPARTGCTGMHRAAFATAKKASRRLVYSPLSSIMNFLSLHTPLAHGRGRPHL